ncbi:hypothetical protein [Halopiger xanaduensis]|uniref:Uncharacterized protein n=1 Tax=Halopiger xanaduensis (strain DSM 18323 / JCM 14033 / SH-6) TaxID=797210 RepID=F8D681_HALXS|nr:hypothetical protein [Halopiger xanaduensis]AEH35327.1 hypothetical protein Halxa_0688 [Halopiger xanaduensis SH-6]
MASGLSALEPGELILLIVSVVGLAPILLRYTSEAKWFAVGYGCIVAGLIATNAEGIALGGVFNGIEHSVGIMGSGIAFAYAVYHRRQALLAASADAVDSAAENGTNDESDTSVGIDAPEA